MSFSIIVARYNECVKWTKEFPNVIIYNKGEILDESFNEILLNNVGREGHTYYKYICDNYDNLSDFTIFLQGRPFDHSPNILKNLNKIINNNERDFNFKWLSERIIGSTLKEQYKNYMKVRTIHKVWKKLFDVHDENHKCVFGAGAQFIVSKDNILKNTKEFYEKIVKMLEYSKDPVEGYVIERIHKYILNPETR